MPKKWDVSVPDDSKPKTIKIGKDGPIITDVQPKIIIGDFKHGVRSFKERQKPFLWEDKDGTG